MGYEPEERRRSLTPLSGELRAVHPAPVRQPGKLRLAFRRRRWLKPPTTMRAAVLRGLIRLTLLVGLVGGVAIWLAWLAGRSASVGLYVAGTICAGVGVVVSANNPQPHYWTPQEREVAINSSFLSAVVGVLLLGLGVLL